MTFARVYGTGSGALRFRLSIEGLPVEFVTSSSMATTAADGRRRVVGLSVEGLKISQRADLVRATIEAQGVSVKIADVAGEATSLFAKRPSATSWLSDAETSTTASIRVKSTANFASSGYIHVNTEAIAYTGKTSTSFTGCTRGRWDTLGQAHYVPDGGQLRFPEVTSAPVVFEGRRARLYIYGAGDSATGDGTQVFLGIVSGEPRMRGPSWSLSMDPISRILAQEFGADLAEPVTPRGIYYPGGDGFWSLRIGIVGGAGGTLLDTFGQVQITFPTASKAFFETQQDFINEINVQLTAALTSYNVDIECRPAPDGGYYFAIVQNSPVDSVGMRLDTPRFDYFFPTNIFSASESGPPLTAIDTVSSFSSNTTYYWFPTPSETKLPGCGLVPRGRFNFRMSETLPPEFASIQSTFPPRRVYLGGAVALPSNTSAVLINWSDPGGQTSRNYSVGSIDTAKRAVELLRDFGGYRLTDEHDYTPSNLPQIRLGRSFTSYGASNIATFLSTLASGSADGVNNGAQPMVRTTGGPVSAPGDVDLTTWSTEIAASDSNLVEGRSYDSFGAISIQDMVAPELQLAGLYLAFDSFGRIIPKRLRLGAATELGTFTITKANLLTDDGFPQYERSAIGKFSTLTVRDGYDPIEDDYTLPSVTVRDVAAFGQTPNSRTVTIEPKSRYVTGAAIPMDAVVRCASTVLGIFGGPYAYITMSVPITGYYLAELGSTVSISTKQLPDVITGTRGVTSLLGVVTSRDVDFYAARIEITVLVSLANIAGYAPSSKVSSQTNTSGNTWAIVLSSSYFAAGETAADHFVAGDVVRVFQYDTASSTEIEGTVVSASSYTVVVTFISTWTPSTLEWVLGFSKSTASATGSRQLSYAFDAGPAATYADASSVAYPAREFAP